MTRQDKIRLGLSVPAALLALSAVVFWLLNSAFVSHAELAPLTEDVRSLESSLYELQRGVQLSNCLQLASLRGHPYQECLQ